MIRAGVCVIDITPPAGLAMSGFAARSGPAQGAHDPLTVRALVVEDTALVCVDVIGIDAAMSRRAREACGLPAEAVTITALHTHGGPVSMPGRLSAEADAAWLARLEAGIVAAIDTAHAAREPVTLHGGTAEDPGFAHNRRHADGPLDAGLPVLRFDRPDGSVLAILCSYACHPVVLGADNLMWTADYPHFLRTALEDALPGAVAVFATGCAGDINTGHTAAASLTSAPQDKRSFAEAERVGAGLAAAVLGAGLTPLATGTAAAEAYAEIGFERREPAPLPELAARWAEEAAEAEGVRKHLLDVWSRWAEASATDPLAPLTERVTALDWGGARILGLPGEIFSATALELRARLPERPGAPSFVLAYADDNPGYIPPRAEYPFGGYEVDEAHRFYGLPAGFAPGSAENLAEAARAALDASGAGGGS
ncbi:MAG: hypothetical protein KDK28_21815 [Maritimibacter sp.]|nr:hypothetical protein [Maritimibacter sp.]